MEQFFKDYEYTIAAISAVATVLAVVISLWVTLLNGNAHRTRLRADASIRMIVVREIDQAQWPYYLVVSVTNVGLMRAKLDMNFMNWRAPYGKRHFMVVPHDTRGDLYVPPKQYPLTIEPNESVTVFVSTLAQFDTLFEDRFVGTGLKKFLAKFMTAHVWTVDGRRFPIKLDAGVKKKIQERTKLFPKKVAA